MLTIYKVAALKQKREVTTSIFLGILRNFKSNYSEEHLRIAASEISYPRLPKKNFSINVSPSNTFYILNNSKEISVIYLQQKSLDTVKARKQYSSVYEFFYNKTSVLTVAFIIGLFLKSTFLLHPLEIKIKNSLTKGSISLFRESSRPTEVATVSVHGTMELHKIIQNYAGMSEI